ncbi:MAG: AMP-binding protein [Candidatus Binatia bacterium]
MARRATPTLLLPTSARFLALQDRRRGATGGLVFAERRVPFGELSAAVDGLVAWLARRGIGAGANVGVLAANTPAMVAALWAVWELGAVAVPVSVRSTAEEVARLLAHARATGLLCDAPRADVARAAARATRVAAWVCASDLPLAPRLLHRGARTPPRTPRSPRPETLAAIAYTSGSTGSPKGVMLTHGNLLWATLACAQARGDRPEGVGACLSALTHVPVLVSHLLCRILLGATAVLFERFDTGALIEAVERWGSPTCHSSAAWCTTSSRWGRCRPPCAPWWRRSPWVVRRRRWRPSVCSRACSTVPS